MTNRSEFINRKRKETESRMVYRFRYHLWQNLIVGDASKQSMRIANSGEKPQFDYSRTADVSGAFLPKTMLRESVNRYKISVSADLRLKIIAKRLKNRQGGNAQLTP